MMIARLFNSTVAVFLGLMLSVLLLADCSWAETIYAPVVPGYKLQFPADHGAHPDFRTEWWYITGWLQDSKRSPLGFQITFFRTRPEVDSANPSSFAPRQILIAHAAISDPAHGRLQHDQRIARAGFGLAEARQGKTGVWIDDWKLIEENAAYSASILARDFRLELKFEAVQPPLLQGEKGFSQKGPNRSSASYYYSLPQLKVSGVVARKDKHAAVTGAAWLDHEWSSQPMDPEAMGWDWVGLNLSDGGALMAFRMRDARGAVHWAGGAHRRADGSVRIVGLDDVLFIPLRNWVSPRTGASYPVSFRVQAGELEFTLKPLMDDQENDTRISTGAIYWEGAVEAFQGDKLIGSGYLELTGYWKPLRL